ncbi:hypothetical protein ScPMuIL_006616 [Solemya velum]
MKRTTRDTVQCEALTDTRVSHPRNLKEYLDTVSPECFEEICIKQFLAQTIFGATAVPTYICELIVISSILI